MRRLVVVAIAAAALAGCETITGAPMTIAEGSSDWLGERLTDIRSARLPTPRLRDLPPPPENVRSEDAWEDSYQDLAARREMLLADPAATVEAPETSPEDFIEDVRRSTGEPSN